MPLQLVKFPSLSERVWFRDDDFTALRGSLKHHACDIFGQRMSDVVTTVDGRVTFAGWSIQGGGNKVEILDVHGYMHRYSHLESVAVSVGQEVGAGQLIGYLGKTGNAERTRCHLHYQVKLRNSSKNPIPELLRLLRLEGRRKEASLCEKDRDTCEWCKTKVRPVRERTRTKATGNIVIALAIGAALFYAIMKFS